MLSRFRRKLDPLDLEIVEMAFRDALDAIKQKNASPELDRDEELEAALRRELMEIACSIGISDPKALRDVLVADLSDRYSHSRKCPRKPLANPQKSRGRFIVVGGVYPFLIQEEAARIGG